MSRFVIFKDDQGEFRWRFLAANHKVIAVASESYVSKSDCEHGIELIKKNSVEAPVQDETATS
ncbi:YegP family protein [Tundrisphaera sp. TA3]|uniref:YegP family protein n=1 Tax=Tundrisphaera sp. TA3 TaxID=3435775 RepID=UPI003EBCAC14